MTDTLGVAVRLARQAGTILLEKRQGRLHCETKQDNTPVCDADKAVSAFLRKNLMQCFPAYGLLDEESPEREARKHPYCWVVDPLDGTNEYLHDGARFGVLIGLMKDHAPILGVAYLPLTDELYFAEHGNGVYLADRNGQHKIAVSPSLDIDAVVSMRRNAPDLAALLNNIQPRTVKKMTTSFKTLEVAKGATTLFLCAPSTTMDLWDLCAPQAILEEAGGRITDVYGNCIDYAGPVVNRNGVIASNGLLHDRILSSCNRRLDVCSLR